MNPLLNSDGYSLKSGGYDWNSAKKSAIGSGRGALMSTCADDCFMDAKQTLAEMLWHIIQLFFTSDDPMDVQRIRA